MNHIQKLSIGSQVKAARSILNMTHQGMSMESKVPCHAIENIECDRDFHNLEDCIRFFNRRGLYLSETGISIIPPALPSAGEYRLQRLGVFSSFCIDPYFVSAWKQWEQATRDRLVMVIEAFARENFDMWFVDMNGQLRIGAKIPGAERGKPFAFIQMKDDGFYLSWHADINVPAMLMGDSSFPVKDDWASRIRINLHFMPLDPIIREQATGMMPDNYDI